MSYAPACDNIKQPSSFLGNVRPKGHNRGIGMRKLFVGIFAIALIAVSLFAFVACDEESPKNTETADVEEAWFANTEWLKSVGAMTITQETSTGTLTFLDETHWNVVVGGGAGNMSKNKMWCYGLYWFEDEEGGKNGVPGIDPLHILLFDYEAYVEETGDVGTNVYDTYDPSSAALVDPDDFNSTLDKNVEAVILPDENGVYAVQVRGVGGFGIIGAGDLPDATMIYSFRPPQDGTLGLEPGATAPLPPAGTKDVGPIVGISIGVIAGIAIIVTVTVVLVKKNKKKKAAAAAAESGAGETFPGDDSEA